MCQRLSYTRARAPGVVATIDQCELVESAPRSAGAYPRVTPLQGALWAYRVPLPRSLGGQRVRGR